jgi:hypothetical protein
VSWRARWLAALLFTLGNWAGQDSLSPQAVSFLLYLCFIAILVSWFGRAPSGTASRRDRGVLLGVLIAIFAAAAGIDLFTSLVMLAACAGLVLARRCRLAGLPVALGVLVVGWLSFAASGVSGVHVSQLSGGLGRLAGSFTAVGDRVAGTGQHQLALDARLGGVVIVGCLAGAGLLRRRHASPDRKIPAADRTLAVLAAVPLIAVALPGYRGDIAPLIYLFALPPAAILGALAFFPRQRAARPWPATAAASVLAVGICLMFLLDRDGNGKHGRTPASELARHAPAGVATPDWTWAGYLLFWLALAALLGREFVALLHPDRRQLITELTLISLPLLAGFGAVVALRIVALS